MNKQIAALSFAELGHEKRLNVILELVKAGPEGLSTGELGRLTKIPNSTLSHHINKLQQAKLVERVKQKQTIVCRVNFTRINELSDFLLDKCCQNSQQDCC